MFQLQIRTGAPRDELVETTVVVAFHNDVRRRRRVVRGLFGQDPVALLRVAGPVVEADCQCHFVAVRFRTGSSSRTRDKARAQYKPAVPISTTSINEAVGCGDGTGEGTGCGRRRGRRHR